MKYLFVGGPKHGEEIYVRDGLRTIFIPETPEPLTAHYFDRGDTHCLKTCCSPSFYTVEYDPMDIGTDRIVYVARRKKF